jgi:hypothetical protein
MIFFITIYSSKFTNETVGIQKEYVGYYYSIWAGSYTISSFFVGSFTKKISFGTV